MVEWVGPLIGAIEVLFNRINRREDKLQQRTDLLKPLLELYHLVSEWERFAKATNSKLVAYLQALTPDERSTAAEELRYATYLQNVRAVDTAARVGVNYPSDYYPFDRDDPVEYRDKLDLRDLVSIYVPDFEDQFRHVMSLRVEQLRQLQELANMHDPAANAGEGLQTTLWAWPDFRSYARPIPREKSDPEQVLRDFEHSANQLSELRREIASFIKTHWDPKDVTF